MISSDIASDNSSQMHESGRRSLLRASAALGLAAFALSQASGVGAAPVNTDQGVKPTPLPAPIKATEGLVDVGDGHSLWYFDTGGDGIPVIFLHAGTGSGLVWPYQTPVFAKAGYRVIGYSRRGYHGSVVGDKAKPGTGAGDLLKLVDHLKLTKFHLVGTAAGGMVATDFAVSHPQRLRSLVLSNTIVGIRDEDYRAIYKLIWPKEFDGLPSDFKELGPSYRHIDQEGRRLWNDLEHKAKTTPMESQAYENNVTWQSIAAWRMPVLVTTGDGDLYTPPSMARLVHSRIQGAEFSLIPDCGHSAYWERPDIWNDLVLGFIKKHGS